MPTILYQDATKTVWQNEDGSTYEEANPLAGLGASLAQPTSGPGDAPGAAGDVMRGTSDGSAPNPDWYGENGEGLLAPAPEQQAAPPYTQGLAVPVPQGGFEQEWNNANPPPPPPNTTGQPNLADTSLADNAPRTTTVTPPAQSGIDLRGLGRGALNTLLPGSQAVTGALDLAPLGKAVKTEAQTTKADLTGLGGAAPITTDPTTLPNLPTTSSYGYPVDGWDKMKTSPKGAHGYNDGKARDGRTHMGVDKGMPEGTPVKAIADGKVVRVIDHEDGDGGGLRVQVMHDDGTTGTYSMHLSRTDVKLHDKVTAGQVIGLSGKSGNAGNFEHLHQQFYKNGKWISEEEFYSGTTPGAAPPPLDPSLDPPYVTDPKTPQDRKLQVDWFAKKAKEAQARVEEIEAQKGSAMQDLYETQKNEYKSMLAHQQDREQERLKIQADLQSKSQQAVERVSKMQVNPNEVWENAGAANSFAAIIGIAMGEMVALRWKRPNTALAVVDNIIARNIDAQKANIGNAQWAAGQQQNLFQQNLQLLGNERMAEAATKMQFLEMAKMEASLQASKFDNPLAAAKHEQFILAIDEKAAVQRAAIDAGAAQAAAAAEEKNYQRGKDSAEMVIKAHEAETKRLKAEGEAAEKKRVLDEKQAGGVVNVYSPGSGTFTKQYQNPEVMSDISKYSGGKNNHIRFGTTEQKKEWDGWVVQADMAYGSISKIETLTKDIGVKDAIPILRSKEGQVALSEVSSLMDFMRGLKGSGASFTETEQQLVKDAAAGDPTRIEEMLNNEALMAKLANAKENLQAEAKTRLATHSYKGPFAFSGVGEAQAASKEPTDTPISLFSEGGEIYNPNGDKLLGTDGEPVMSLASANDQDGIMGQIYQKLKGTGDYKIPASWGARFNDDWYETDKGYKVNTNTKSGNRVNAEQVAKGLLSGTIALEKKLSELKYQESTTADPTRQQEIRTVIEGMEKNLNFAKGVYRTLLTGGPMTFPNGETVNIITHDEIEKEIRLYDKVHRQGKNP